MITGKLHLLLPLLMLFLAPGIFAAPGDDAVILDTRSKFNEINKKIPEYTRREGDLEPGDPGSLTGYFSGSELVKCVYATGDNLHEQSHDCYFRDNRPIFVYIKIRALPVPGNTWKSSEDRLYFHDGRLYRWLKGTTPVSKADRSFTARGNEVLRSVNSYRQGFK
jgi:hypothetical protein